MTRRGQNSLPTVSLCYSAIVKEQARKFRDAISISKTINHSLTTRGWSWEMRSHLLRKVTFILDRRSQESRLMKVELVHQPTKQVGQPTSTIVCSRLVPTSLRTQLLLLIACALQAELIFVIFTRTLKQLTETKSSSFILLSYLHLDQNRPFA